MAHYMCYLINQSVSRVTGLTPFYMLFGRKIGLPRQRLSHSRTPIAFVKELQRSMMTLSQTIPAHRRMAQEEYVTLPVTSFTPGQWVFVYAPKAHNLDAIWRGPFKIIKKKSPYTYMVQFPRGIKAISARLIRSAPVPTTDTVFTEPNSEEPQEAPKQTSRRRSARLKKV